MIHIPTDTEMRTLEAFKKTDCLSIYVPYIAPNQSGNPNRIQLKNLLKQANQTLSAEGLNKTKIDSLLKPAKELVDSNEFRINYKHSLVLFIGQGFFRYYHLPPEGVTASVILGASFDIQQIDKLISDNPSYFILLLSHNGAKLLIGNKYDIEEIQSFPSTMRQDLRIDENPKSFQTHSIAPATSGKESEIVHGQYNKSQVDKEMLTEFFQHIEKKVNKIVKNEKTPLVLAGVDYVLSLYRQINTYPHTLRGEIAGNLENLSLDQIRKLACESVA